MKKLTRGEREVIDLIERSNHQILFGRKLLNPGRFVPQRVEIQPQEARQMIRLNRFISTALNWIGKKADPKSAARAEIRLRLVYLRDVNRMIRSLLERQPGRRAPLILTGKEATIYYSNLEIVHAKFPVFRLNYLESATDMDRADQEAGEAWWAIRSIINVGHLPVQKRSERFRSNA